MAARSARAMISAALLAAAAISAPPASAAGPQALSIERIESAPFPFGMAAAPSGGAVAWIYNEQGARNVWVATPDGRGGYASRRLTAYQGDAGVDISGLRWSGDGRWLVYTLGGDRGGRVAVNPSSLAEGPKSGAIWAAPLAGGPPRRLGEAHSAFPAPSGDAVVLVRGAEALLANAAGGQPAPLFTDRGKIADIRWAADGKRFAFVSERPNHSMVGVFDLAARTVTWLAPSIDRDALPVWSPDSRRVAFVRTPSGEERPQGLNREGTPWSLWTADASSGEGRQIWVSRAGAGSRFRPLFNSDDSLFWAAGDQIVFPWEATGWLRLYAVPAAGGEARLLTPGKSEVFAGQLSPDRSKVVFAGNEGDLDRRHIWEAPVAGGAARQLTHGAGVEDMPLVASDGAVLALQGDATRPLRPVQVTKGGTVELAPGAIPGDYPAAALVEPRLVTFPAADGRIVHGQLFTPKGLKGKAPAVLFFHGGPTNRQAFAAWDPFETHSHLYAANQFLAAHGYIVLSINYRGGSGYGLDWREAERFGATGASELQDIVGAAKYLQQLPEADPARLGVWGGSYGGRMASLAMARAPEFWKAGVDYAGVHNLATQYAAKADPATKALAYESSAVAHADSWRAPVLLIVGDADELEPQTVELAAALRARGVPVEQMMLPDETHFMLRHQSWAKVFQATKDYLDRHLKP